MWLSWWSSINKLIFCYSLVSNCLICCPFFLTGCYTSENLIIYYQNFKRVYEDRAIQYHWSTKEKDSDSCRICIWFSQSFLAFTWATSGMFAATQLNCGLSYFAGPVVLLCKILIVTFISNGDLSQTWGASGFRYQISLWLPTTHNRRSLPGFLSAFYLLVCWSVMLQITY